MNKATRYAVLAVTLCCCMMLTEAKKKMKCKKQADCATGQFCVEPATCAPGSSSISSSSYGCAKRCVAGLGAHCGPKVDCMDKHADCIDHECVCGDGYIDSNGEDYLLGTCEADLGAECDFGATACHDEYAICEMVISVCVCDYGYYDSNLYDDGGICRPGLGARCSENAPCDDCNAICDCETKMCVCGPEYNDNNGDAFCGGCGPASCKPIYKADPSAASGEYTIYTSDGTPVTVFCDFYKNRGFTYILRPHLSSFSDFEDLYTESDEATFGIKILYDNDEQHFLSMEQLSQYKGFYPLSLQLSQNVGYNTPKNFALAPYMYMGFVPKEFAAIISSMPDRQPQQGYRSGGIDTTFVNCDQNPNSYLVLMANDAGIAEHSYYTNNFDTPRMYNWLKQSQLLPASRTMDSEFYYMFEMHMGGCGGYISSSNVDYVDGIALGFEFKMTDDHCHHCNEDCVDATLVGQTLNPALRDLIYIDGKWMDSDASIDIK